MRRQRIRIATGAMIVLTLVAAALTIANRPRGPGGGGQDLYECTLWFTVAELLVLAAYAACIFRCNSQSDDGEARQLCYYYCLMWWLYLTIALILGYVTCLVRAVWF